jgi:hypothetical protein
MVGKSFEGVKMTTAKPTSIQERSRIYTILLQDLMKMGCLQAYGEDGLIWHNVMVPIRTLEDLRTTDLCNVV